MLTGPTVAPIGDLSDSAGPTAGTISVALEEMPAIADGLDTVSRTCADRTMPILGIAAETRLFLGINGRAQQAAGLCAGLATDLGGSALKFSATAAAVRAAHSSYLQTENIVAGWFESMGIAKDGKLPDGRSTRDHLRGLIAGEPGEADYLIKLTFPELGYFSASRALPYSPLVAGILFGFTAYMDATWNPEIARSRTADRLADMFGIPRGLVRKALGGGLFGIIKSGIDTFLGAKAHNIRTASADEYGIAAHRGEKNQLSVGASSDRLLAIGKAQDLELERSRQNPSAAERGAVLVTVMYEAGHEGDPAHALYVVSIPGTVFDSLEGSPIDPAGITHESSRLGYMNAAYEMVLQALRDAGAPQGARVYMEGFSQGAMIAYNMANSQKIAEEINIVGIYAQGTPLRVMPAKQRDFAVDYVEGEGDGVPDVAEQSLFAQIFKGAWRPDERDTVITVDNYKHHAENYQEALYSQGYSSKVPGGMRAAMDGKEYVLGEQKVTSASTMPDGLPSAVRIGITAGRIGTYGGATLASGTGLSGWGVVEAIDGQTGGHLAKAKRKVRESIENIRQNVEDTVSDVQQGMEIAKQKAEGLQREVGEAAWAVAQQIPAVIEGAQKTIPHPEPTPSEKPQSPPPAWPETPAPQMPKAPLLQGYNPQHLPPAINMPSDLSRPEPAPIKMPARIEAEGQLPPAGLIPPDILPKPVDLHTHIEKAVTQPFIEQLQLPSVGSALKNPPIFQSGQGGDYDGGESLIPTLPDLKPAPMLPPKSIDPGFLAPTPPENIDPGFRAPGPPEDLTPLEEREPLMV
ncbi:MAG: extensin [Rothia sp.]|uniref:extensin n=1 Tax=Rothia sp. (in: high G+C Gram-positive bacteria) TaxID=1885016 RepID=UPI001CADAD1E|nr:extensin [Rothia sp. (in: high G+C Gram-positive bacteria)]MBF1681348.1 extensin [Rothia sp. (in: high G+C Gram-positive bacteria)]